MLVVTKPIEFQAFEVTIDWYDRLPDPVARMGFQVHHYSTKVTHDYGWGVDKGWVTLETMIMGERVIRPGQFLIHHPKYGVTILNFEEFSEQFDRTG